MNIPTEELKNIIATAGSKLRPHPCRICGTQSVLLKHSIHSAPDLCKPNQGFAFIIITCEECSSMEMYSLSHLLGNDINKFPSLVQLVPQ